MKNHFYLIQMLAIILLCFKAGNVQAQLVVTNSTNYYELADSFMESGIAVNNVTYTGNVLACGYFTNGDSTNLGTNSGIVLSTGRVTDINNGASFFGSYSFGDSGNVLLTTM
jgi:hypothetical protein